MTFEEQIKEWVSIDNQIKLLNDKLRDLRGQRSETGSDIIKYVETENLTNATVQISDGKLKFTETRQIAPLSLKYVKDCLLKCIRREDQVDEIMRFIKESRESKVFSDIRRTYVN